MLSPDLEAKIRFLKHLVLFLWTFLCKKLEMLLKLPGIFFPIENVIKIDAVMENTWIVVNQRFSCTGWICLEILT